MSANLENKLNELVALQHESLRLLRFLAHRHARQLIEENLTRQIERRVYELSDGLRSSRDIEKEIGKEVTQRTVVSWWQRWVKLGIAEKSPTYSGRVRKLIPLDEVGLTIEEALKDD